MKYKNIGLRLFSMALVGCLSFAPMAVYADPTDTDVEVEASAVEELEIPEDAIHLATAEDILALAENCVLDTWSVDKTVVLDNDIDMSSVEFEGIPTFGGTFFGCGYKITGLYMEHEASVVGFFRYLQKTAEVNDLHIEGEILPEGTSKIVGAIAGSNAGTITDCSFNGEVSGKEQVGGLVGYNKATGIIENCNVLGMVHGNHVIGGIAGKNAGVIRYSSNQAEVNTKSSQNSVGMDLNDLSLENLTTYESIDNATEIGGIAGKSSGVIRECNNKAKIGYKKMGYNIGGIVGTQNGYMVDCINYGTVEGADGVGGIVGQFMPSIVMDFGPDPVETIKYRMNSVKNSMQDLTKSVEDMAHSVNTDTTYLQNGVSDMKDSVDALEGAVDLESGKYDEDTLSAAVNSMSSSLNNVYAETANRVNSIDMTDVSEKMNNMMGEMERMVNSMNSLSVGIDINDVSRKDKEQDTVGKIANCVNYGGISGKTAIGGIAGILDSEHNTQEDNIEVNGDLSSNGKATIRLVVRDCKNYGTISASNNYAGGIAGQMVVGAIFDCKNIGNMDSLNANYVGGIAGSCETVIFDSFSKSIMAGSNYVGGIAGYATEVIDSYAFVDVLAADEYVGAVIGDASTLPDEDALISGNAYFVPGKNIGGIDGVSYEGAADAISLEYFLAIENLDDMYKNVKVRFVAYGQDDVIMEVGVGETIPYEKIPTVAVAETDMYDWVLDKPISYEVLAMGEEEEIIYASDARLSNILFDQTYEVDFERKNSVSEGEGKTTENKSVVLAIGAFEKNTKVELKDALAKESIVSGDDVFENWEVNISNRGIEKLHYRIPEGKEAEQIVLYVKSTTGTWEEREFFVEGSYLVFEFTGADSGFALAEKFVLSPIVILIAAGVVVLGGIVFLKKRKSKKK